MITACIVVFETPTTSHAVATAKLPGDYCLLGASQKTTRTAVDNKFVQVLTIVVREPLPVLAKLPRISTLA